MIYLIAAVAENGVIGNNGQLPWHYPSDLRFFRLQTLNQAVLMGATTYRSIGQALPHRINYVATNTDEEFTYPVIKVSDARQFVLDYQQEEDLYIIGGASIYRQLIDLAEVLIITHIPGQPAGDTYFPDYQEHFVLWKEEVVGELTVGWYRRKR